LEDERSYGDMLVLLCDLDKHSITTEQLETTDVVRVLYRVLKSCKDETMKKTVKSLLAKWKREYSGKRTNLGQSEKTDLTVKSEMEPCLEKEANDNSKTEQSSNLSSVRLKCVQLLTSAIAFTHDIENHIHNLYKSNLSRYKTCVRSKIANLKNPKSRHLREGLFNGSLPPQLFAQMSSEDMASPDLQRLRREYSSQSVSERQLPQGVEGTPTRKIRCKRCDGTECRVTQVSRDDDSMTFVTCGTCGQQWYHNNWVCL
uniref:Transcription elongation factor A N-terminal and central domain containing n=1 Tax=Neogobius melanostomus TaxID=47308 RepID=A0A8C6UET1_9GOBI